MSFLIHGLKAKVMSTELVMEANVSKKVLFEALDIVHEFEETYSAYKENSLLNKINKNAGIKAVLCKKHEIELFQKALEMAETSKGLFDPTIGVLTQGTYGFGKLEARVPSQKELQKVKGLVNFHDLSLSSNEVYLKKKGMRLDLGGIGKGYIAQRIIKYLRQRGATKVLVNVGGEICTVGKEYNIAIQDPYSSQNIAVIKTTSSALCISTSGDYERFIGSKQNHHILDNKTAVQNYYYSSITIIQNGEDATLLDAVATIVFNTPPEHLSELAKKNKVAIIAIVEDGELIFKNFKSLKIRALELYSL